MVENIIFDAKLNDYEMFLKAQCPDISSADVTADLKLLRLKSPRHCHARPYGNFALAAPSSAPPSFPHLQGTMRPRSARVTAYLVLAEDSDILCSSSV